jgi:hypothetical protein
MNGYQKMKTVSLPDLQESDDDALANLKKLAGIDKQSASINMLDPNSNPTGDQYSANNKAIYMKENNIKPGTDAWFKLWFARTDITGERPF